MAAPTNVHGFNVGGNNNSFDQRGHFYRGIIDGNVSGMLVKQNSTPNMTVLVEHGSALLNKNTTSASVAEIKSDTSVTIDTANTSNPRIDTVVIYEDTSVAIPTVEANYWQDGAGGRFKIVSLPGTAGASPVALSDANIQTAIGAGKPWARLANITVPANSTTILNSNITDARQVIGYSGAWQPWTTTWGAISGGTNTLGNGTLVSSYKRISNTVFFRIKLTWGSTTSSNGVDWSFTPPFACIASMVQIPIGHSSMSDAGVNEYFGDVRFFNQNTIQPRSMLASGTYVSNAAVMYNTPFTWGSGDVLSISGSYEIA